MDEEQPRRSGVVDAAVTSAFGTTAVFLVVQGFRADAYDTAALVFAGLLFLAVVLGSVLLQRRRLRRTTSRSTAVR